MNTEQGFRGFELVSKAERKEGSAEKLHYLVANIAEQINAYAEKECGIKGLLNVDGTISMEGFALENGGIYSKEELDTDLAQVHGHELSNSVSERLPTGSPEQLARVKDWQQSRERSKANQVEMAIMVLLHKMLKDEFLVLRSAKRDDYEGGVDNLIVNKQTGAVICAIDDVHKEGEDDSKKAEKTKRVALNGGTTVKYGVVSRKGQLERTKLDNVPVFYLGLNSQQFNELMSGMGDNLDSPVSGKEREIFSQFVQSLENQKNNIGSLIFKPGSGIRKNISQLGAPIKRLKQIDRAWQQDLPAAA